MIKSYKAVHTMVVAASLFCTIIHAADPTFHLKNKSSDAIQIDIMQNGSSILKPTGPKRVAKGGEFAFQVDISMPTTLDINYCPSADFCKANLPEKLTATFKAGKTIYIKFDGKELKPQTGSLLTGKTTAGYNLKNNVSAFEMPVPVNTPRKSLKTGTKESIAEEIKKNKPKPAKPKPTMPNVPPHKPTPPVAIPSNLDPMEETAWKEFDTANKFRKSNNASLGYLQQELERMTKKEQQIVLSLAHLVLGVQAGASKAEITKAYKKLSLKYHPDRYSGNKDIGTEAFKIISSAYTILTNGPTEPKFTQEPEQATKQQELMLLLSGAPEIAGGISQTLLMYLSHATYNKENLTYISKHLTRYPAEDLGPDAAEWKDAVLTFIHQELKDMK